MHTKNDHHTDSKKTTAGYVRKAYGSEKRMDLKKILVERLEKKGVDSELIPGLMKNIAAVLDDRPEISHEEVTEKMHYLGWNGLELDENTLQIIIADHESNPPNYPVHK